VVNAVDGFKMALDQVPLVLLESEDVRVLTDARTSADVLGSLLSSPVAVVLVGSTGVGKSHLVNGIAGIGVSRVGDLRPTTTTVITAGSSGPAAVDHASEYVYVRGMPTGVAVVDTPAWESGRAVIIAALSNADVGVLIVSPSRYADATTAELWIALKRVPSRVVVLNRLRGTPSERDEILGSVRERFFGAEIVLVDEAADSGGLLDAILSGIPYRQSRESKAAIARAAATQAGRYVAGVVTSGSVELGQLAAAIDEVTSSESVGQNLAVRETWSETKRELVEAIVVSVHEVDSAVVGSADNAVAVRVLEAMGTWQSSQIENALDDWQIDVAAHFRSNATIRWRRRSTEQIIERESWKAAVNPSVRVPKRVRRTMRSNLESSTTRCNDLLISIFDAAIDQRLEQWRGIVTEAASFKPGELLAAAQALEAR
jgi:energy-coupling factor transporter ATP-binding protein EcfA2